MQNLPILKSVIYETLRLFLPVPIGPARVLHPEGLTIGGIHIPGNTTIFGPRYRIARRESALQSIPKAQLIYVTVENSFERASGANEFIQERLTSKLEIIRDKGAFAPFSQGIIPSEIQSTLFLDC